jgi:energy-coupling factor transporter ATP-binding protein EcfA2
MRGRHAHFGLTRRPDTTRGFVEPALQSVVEPAALSWHKEGMRPRWQLQVEGLGRIGQADVEVRPLLLLVGENNTGKSYLASLLWGLVAMQNDLTPPEGPALKACNELLRAWIHEGSHSGDHELTSDEVALFDQLFETALDAGHARLVKRIFNSDTVSAGRVMLRNTSLDRRANFSWRRPAEGSYTFSIAHEHARAWAAHHGRLVTAPLDEFRSLVADQLSRYLAFGPLTGSVRPFNDFFQKGDPVFLPASRTGFMLLYKAAARRSMKQVFRADTDDALAEHRWLNLTTPAFHFIDMLALGLEESREARFADEAEFLEQHALQGTIERSAERGLNDYRYRTDGPSQPLSMHLSSSLVSELAPIVLVLRHLSQFPVLILEEPEAHLHPSVQRRLAQVIVRLVRKGLYVWITTHSENFCQQINNFLKIGMSPDREALQTELGYGPQDYLELDDVSGYGFQIEGGQSIVTRLDASEEGLTMPTFNRELIALSKETLLLQRRTGKNG